MHRPSGAPALALSGIHPSTKSITHSCKQLHTNANTHPGRWMGVSVHISALLLNAFMHDTTWHMCTLCGRHRTHRVPEPWAKWLHHRAAIFGSRLGCTVAPKSSHPPTLQREVCACACMDVVCVFCLCGLRQTIFLLPFSVEFTFGISWTFPTRKASCQTCCIYKVCLHRPSGAPALALSGIHPSTNSITHSCKQLHTNANTHPGRWRG